MYIPPNYGTIPFKFDRAGYSAPDFNSIAFKYGGEVANLKAAIIGSELQRDYLKHCEQYVLGYDQNNIQIIKHSCVYGGIRDLNAAIKVLVDYLDLSNYVKSTQPSSYDLIKQIRGLQGIRSTSVDLVAILKGQGAVAPIDLPVYLKQGEIGQQDLFKYLNVFQHSYINLRYELKGWSLSNVRDLVNAIKPWQNTSYDLQKYIKSTEQVSKDLTLDIFKIWQTQQDDINVLLHSWQQIQLQGILQALHIKDLTSYIKAISLANLSAILYCILPINLSASVMGWATYNLPVSIIDVRHPGDLYVDIYGISSKNLGMIVLAKQALEVTKDLTCYTTNLQELDLLMHLNSLQYRNLNIYLTSSRQLANLTVTIYPKIIYVKQHINIAFLENRDLVAIINFPCFNSSFRELLASIEGKVASDLRSYIYGYDSSNIVDLNCRINSSAYITQDKISAQYLRTKSPVSYTTLAYDRKSIVYSISNITIIDSTINRSYLDLSTRIAGQYIQKDLSAYIRAYANRHSLTDAVTQKFITLKLKNNEEDFRRYVEITFNNYANDYYYFSGSKKAYRAYKKDHWEVRVEGSEFLPKGRGFEKTKVRRKYIFNLSNYSSIDEAIRDMVDRVTLLKSLNLAAYIECTNDRVSDLNVRVFSRRVYKTNRVLLGKLKPVVPSSSTLSLYIKAALLTDSFNLTTSITGLVPSDPLAIKSVSFNFTGTGDNKPAPTDADFIFDSEDIK